MLQNVLGHIKNHKEGVKRGSFSYKLLTKKETNFKHKHHQESIFPFKQLTKISKHMHHMRKTKTFEAFKKRNTQDLMKQLKEPNFTKNVNFAHE